MATILVHIFETTSSLYKTARADAATFTVLQGSSCPRAHTAPSPTLCVVIMKLAGGLSFWNGLISGHVYHGRSLLRRVGATPTTLPVQEKESNSATRKSKRVAKRQTC